MRSLILGTVASVFVLSGGVSSAAPSGISYRRDVAPILKRHCTTCHTKNDAQGDLNLDSVKSFRAGGKSGPAFLPRKPDASLVLRMLTGAKKPAMPYKQPPLSPVKVSLLRQWILDGAKDDSDATPVVEHIVIPTTYRIAPAVTSLCFSPDGNRLAVACRSEVVVLAVDGKGEPQRLPTESDLLTCVCFSPDGQTLAAVGGSPGQYGEVRLFGPSPLPLSPGGRGVGVRGTFQLRSTRRIGKDTLFRGGFAPDGRNLALGGADGAVYLVPAGNGAVRKFDLHSDWVSAVAWSVDGRLLISGSRDKTIKVSLADSGRLIRSIATSTDYVNAVAATSTLAISAGRDRVPATYDLKLALGEVALRGTGNEMGPDRPSAQYTRPLEGQPGEVLDLALNAKRTVLAVAGNFSEARLYALPEGRRLATLPGLAAPVYGIALSSDGTRAATGSSSGQVGIYDAVTGKLIRQLVPVPLERKN